MVHGVRTSWLETWPLSHRQYRDIDFLFYALAKVASGLWDDAGVPHQVLPHVSHDYAYRKTGRGGGGGSRVRGDRSDGLSEQKLYMQPPLLELRVPEPEIMFLTDLPGGLDHNEWMASHSKHLPTNA